MQAALNKIPSRQEDQKFKVLSSYKRVWEQPGIQEGKENKMSAESQKTLKDYMKDYYFCRLTTG